MEDQPPSAKASKVTNKVPFELHPRADAIRSKLIYTFYLIDYLRGLGSAIPRHNMRDFLDHRKLKKLMVTDHHQLVRFNVVPRRNIMVTRETRCRNRIRVRCSRWPPVAMWAYSVLNSQIFKVFMICLICLNMVVLMILVEIVDNLEDHFVKMRIAMEVIIWVIILIFLTEIGLNWAVSFQDYCKNPWNVFDCTVTIISFIPELICLVEKKHTKATRYFLQVCRVLRGLKLFPRLRQIKILIMALFKAMKAMSFILVLLVFFFYIFAVSGIFFFEGYTRSNQQDLEYNNYFKDMPNSLVTIFILFTMDHWYALLQDTWKVPEINKVISGLFIWIWLLIGAFIFRNLMVATMVTNFQTIRNELSEEMQQIETQQKADKFKLELQEKKFSLPQVQDMSLGPSTIYSLPEVDAGPLDWETYIHKNLPGLYEADDDEQVIWPRDSLFRYFELLEKLQYNLDERKHLQNYAVLALSNLEDK
ncbi:cation channel sperm-associated protein 2 [Lacerta agilis]|uniref:cation channel sperm-associated protein 2 n=1 Tax=Lacerta agilis TaxID=80427 RepID=UPI001419D040|nr:cation channel sperm-associated protein 2 [Lacerta agilis]